MGALATIGLIDTASITLERWGVIGELACPGGADGCDQVLNSVWGTVLGQPLALFGVLAYGAMVLLSLLPLIPGVQQWLINLQGSGSTLGSRRNGRAPDLFWQLGYLLSLAMAVFSLVLVGLMLFRIQAICAFCLLSAALSLALLVLHWIGREWDDRGQLVFRTVIVAVLVALVSLAWVAAADRPDVLSEEGAPPPVTAVSTPAKLALAEHLNSIGARMYSAYWCPHCHEQKQEFGAEAAAKLDVIECASDGKNSQAALCQSKAIEGFPSWEINGQIDSGVKSLQKLADLSGYKGPRNF
jgi:uncharacterized membrane protein/glutaredoxin